MRESIFSLVIFSLLSCCGKLDKKLDQKYNCDKLSGVHKFVYEPIVISDDDDVEISKIVKPRERVTKEKPPHGQHRSVQGVQTGKIHIQWSEKICECDDRM